MQLANIRVRAIGVDAGLRGAERARSGDGGAARAARCTLEADAWFRVDGELQKVVDAVLRPRELLAGNVIEGPAIVTQFDSTTVVPPGFTCTVDPVGHLVITYSDEILAAAQQHTTAGAAAR